MINNKKDFFYESVIQAYIEYSNPKLSKDAVFSFALDIAKYLCSKYDILEEEYNKL